MTSIMYLYLNHKLPRPIKVCAFHCSLYVDYKPWKWLRCLHVCNTGNFRAHCCKKKKSSAFFWGVHSHQPQIWFLKISKLYNSTSFLQFRSLWDCRLCKVLLICSLQWFSMFSYCSSCVIWFRVWILPWISHYPFLGKARQKLKWADGKAVKSEIDMQVRHAYALVRTNI